MIDLFAEPLPAVLRLKVTPKAKHEHVKVSQHPDGGVLYKVYVNAPAEDGKANAAVLHVLARCLGIAASRLVITQGHTSRNKIVRVIDP